MEETTNPEVARKESLELENYPPYKKFIERVGGPHVLIPPLHGIPQMLRIHMDELTYGFDIPPLQKDPQLASLTRDVDALFSYRPGSEAKYPHGDRPTKDGTPARIFFEKLQIGSAEIKKIDEVLGGAVDDAIAGIRDRVWGRPTIDAFVHRGSYAISDIAIEAQRFSKSLIAKGMIVEIIRQVL